MVNPFNVKKLILSTLAICLILSASAQFKIGVQGGLNISKMQNSLQQMISRTDNIRLGPNLGIMVGMDLGESKLSILQEFSYSTKGLLYNGLSQAAESVEGNIYINYLEMPLNLLYYSGIGRGHFFFGGGPYVALGLNGQTKVVYNSKEVETTEIIFGSEPGTVKKTDFGAQGVLGYKLGYGSYIKLFYSHGLSNLSNTPGESIHNRNVGVCFGYFFGSGRSK
jgi:hypothetical protein